MRSEVIEVMIENLHKFYGNPSSSHHWGRLSRSSIETARKRIAGLLNADSSEIIFTSGGTEANNMILTTAVQHLKVKRILTSPLEHKSVLEISCQLYEIQGVIVEFIKLKSNGIIDLEDLEDKLKTSSLTTLVSLMHANNEIGNILPLSRVGEICKKYKAWFHADTMQTIGHYRLDLQSAGMDFASCSAHKFYGPAGVGFAFLRKNSMHKGFIIGGPQERGLRAGTENICGILGMARALECALEGLEKERSHIESLKVYAISELQKAVPSIRFNGLSAHLDQSLYMVLNISLPLRDGLLSFYLDLRGIAVSQGSACLSGSIKPSHVIEAIYESQDRENTTNLRISFGYSNTRGDIDKLTVALKEYMQENAHKS